MQNPGQAPFTPPPIPPPSNPLPPGTSPTMSPAEERNWAVAIHLSSFCGYLAIPLGHIWGPLILWLMKKDGSSFLDAIGKETVNYNISIMLWFALTFALFFTIIGIPLALLLLAFFSVMDIVVTILAAIAASNGKQYRYPLTIRFIS